ncbi:alpha/beta fold hydrolase [Amycolatopsis nigrescens]|uniref:alpha/beta fold hydrolase n=1 Tax=Amycolatopsis nigrescens TaxID=381445 RepID=UPI000370181B|nr:alpha/beta hydrolase [Amycolatopsis nigrescens]
MPSTAAHNGDEIYFEAHGEGPVVLLYNADPRVPEHPLKAQATGLREALVEELSGRYRVVLLSYPGKPKDDSLTPETVTTDLLAVADAAGADRFAWWGYSWGGVIGLQLAIRTDRLTALAMTGFPPVDGPYSEMLHCSRVIAAADPAALGIPAELAVQYPQFVKYYEGLQGFDDRAAQRDVSCPKLCFVGGADELSLGGEFITHLGDTVAGRRDELESLGWEVDIVPGEDHVGACRADVVVPRLSAFFDEHLR